jgi:hypothetical protein
VEYFLDINPETRPMIKAALDHAPDGYVAHIGPNKRSLEQNKKLWAMLTDVAAQVQWYGQKLSPYDWKNMFTASLDKTKCVPGIDGGVVVLGSSTSHMNKAKFAELIELITAFGAERGVKWKDLS